MASSNESEPIAEPVAAGSDVSDTGAAVASSPALPTRSHAVAGLLGIFLGALGMHKFYLGYIDAGFIMLAVTIVGSLLSFGLAGAIMWLFGIVEGVIYLSKDQSAFEREYVRQRREWF